jgi:hypothetical protein
MKDETARNGKNLLQNPSLLWDFVLLLHIYFLGISFYLSNFWHRFSATFESGDWALTGLVIGLGIYFFLLAVTLVVFAATNRLIKYRHIAGVISGFLSFFVILTLGLAHPTLQALHFIGSGFFLPSLLLCLLFSLTFYLHGRYERFQAFRLGDTSVQLSSQMRGKLLGDGGSEKRSANTFLIVSAVLLFGLILLFWSYLYDYAFGGPMMEDALWSVILNFLAETLFSCFAFIGAYFWGLWRICRPLEKNLALLPGILVLLVAVGVFRSPSKMSDGRKDSVYYAYYSREKWADANPDLRNYMLPDFEKQVDLVGKDYATVIYYLGAPSTEEKEEGGSYSLEYDIGLVWNGTRYYAVTLSKADIVMECGCTFRD